MGCTPAKPQRPVSANQSQIQANKRSFDNRSTSSVPMSYNQNDRTMSQICAQQPSLIANPSTVEVVGYSPSILPSKMRFTEIKVNSNSIISSKHKIPPRPKSEDTHLRQIKSFINLQLLPNTIENQQMNPPPIYSFAYCMDPNTTN